MKVVSIIVAVGIVGGVAQGCNQPEAPNEKDNPNRSSVSGKSSDTEEPMTIGGRYWTAYFYKDSKDPSLGNFMFFGILPVDLNSDKTVTSELFGKATWRWDGKSEVVFTPIPDEQPGDNAKSEEASLEVAYVASDGGDVLTAKIPVHFGFEDNRIRLLRDNSNLRKQYLGQYKLVSKGTEYDEIGDSIVFGEKTVFVGGEYREWLAAGEYVVLIGGDGSSYNWPSIVLRSVDGGKTLRFVPSDPYKGFGAAEWGLEYKKI